MPAPTESLVAPHVLDRLRTAFDGFTVDGVRELIGPVGGSAMDRGDLAGVSLALPGGERVSTLVRLFLLGQAVARADAVAALHPLSPDDADGILEADGGDVRARVEVRPYGEDGAAADPWWVVSDFGSDVRPGPLAPDHVLGIGAASLSLAQATIRTPVGRALDLGTGCGIQALHLSGHSESVTVTDVSTRALRLAATTAALSGQRWHPRVGSLLDPVAGEQFDQVVANPPFVVSPGLDARTGGYDYRDSGLTGDAVCAELLRGIPGVLAPGGTASLLANWVITADESWTDRLSGWLGGRGCDAWIWQREVAEPGEYVALWLRDAGERPGTARWDERYRAWVHWFATTGVLAVGMGVVTLWRSDRQDPQIVCEDVPQALAQPIGTDLPAWITRRRWLSDHDDDALLAARLQCADGLVRTRADVAGDDGWITARTTLRLSHGMRWEVEADEVIASLVGGCTGRVPLATLVEVLAAGLAVPVDDVAVAVVPVVRDLVARGVLEPSGEASDEPAAAPA